MKRIALFALCGVLFAAYAHAGAPLELGAYLALVERHNPELRAAEKQRGLSLAEERIARAYPNPEIDVAAGPSRPSGLGPAGTSHQWGLSQRIELPSIREARIGAAHAGIAVTDAYIEHVRQHVGFQSIQAFFDTLRRTSELALAQETAKLLAAMRERVRARVEVGEAPRFELTRVDTEALVALNLAESARLRLEEARAVMRRLAGNALPLAFEPSGAMPERAALQPLPILQAQMLESHPLLRSLVAESARARARLDHELALRNPQPTLRIFQTNDPDVRQTLVGVALPLPLWNRRSGQIAQAQSAVEVAAAQREAQRVQLLRELDSAYARYDIARRLTETFENGLLTQSDAALRVAEAAYRAGERSFLEVLDAQRTLRAVRGDYIQARFDRVAAQLDIERLLARDPYAFH
jgi:cobalt-zinc-cadmium efflux system outer membrane protein